MHWVKIIAQQQTLWLTDKLIAGEFNDGFYFSYQVHHAHFYLDDFSLLEILRWSFFDKLDGDRIDAVALIRGCEALTLKHLRAEKNNGLFHDRQLADLDIFASSQLAFPAYMTQVAVAFCTDNLHTSHACKIEEIGIYAQ